jgi:hypothetical protein
MEITEILELVKKDLAKRLNKTEIQDFEEVPLDVAEEMLYEEGLPVLSDFKTQLVNPWAIAKYMALLVQEKTTITQVEEDLHDFIPDTVEIFFMRGLTCEVQFRKKFEEGVKQQCLTVKYFLDEDDKVQYKLVTKGPWGWDITKAQLKALLSNSGFFGEKLNDVVPQKTKWYKRIFKRG